MKTEEFNLSEKIEDRTEIGIVFAIFMFIAIICQAITLNFHWTMCFVFLFIYLPLDLYTINKIIKFIFASENIGKENSK